MLDKNTYVEALSITLETDQLRKFEEEKAFFYTKSSEVFPGDGVLTESF